MAFRFQGRHVALTYPQSRIPKTRLFDFLRLIRNVDRVLVAQENHSNGGIHYHCYVAFSSSCRVNIRDPRFFDLDEEHPNFQGCRNIKDWIKYCTKEDPEPLSTFPLNNTSIFLQILDHIDAGEKNTHEIFSDAIHLNPQLLLNSSNIITGIDYLKAPSTNTYQPLFALDSFKLTAPSFFMMKEFQIMVLGMQRGDRLNSKSLWIFGPSMLGKTALARSLGTHWYMQGAWNLSKISIADHCYGVIDDLPWDSLQKYYKGLLGRQTNVTFTDKYTRKQELPMGFPVIVLSNELPEFSTDQVTWLRSNVDFFCLDNPIHPNSSSEANMYRIFI